MSLIDTAARGIDATVPVLRWGIAGAGDIAERVMAPAMRSAPHAELVAVARRDRTAAESFAERHGARRAYDSVQALVADPEVDAVYVATPVDRHAADVIAASSQGRHVLVEKPMALTIAETAAMRDAAAAAGVALWTCFYQRYNQRHLRVRELLADGVIGRVTAVRMNFSGRSPARPGAWRQDPARSGGGSFIDSASHCVDLLRFLFGEVEAVAAFTGTLVEPYPVEDTASALLRLSGGVQALVTAHWSTADPSEDRSSVLEIGGTDGVIITAPLHDKHSRGRLTVATSDGREDTRTDFEASTHVALLEDIAARLADGRPPAVSAADGIAALRVVEAVYEAARTGRTILLP